MYFSAGTLNGEIISVTYLEDELEDKVTPTNTDLQLKILYGLMSVALERSYITFDEAQNMPSMLFALYSTGNKDEYRISIYDSTMANESILTPNLVFVTKLIRSNSDIDMDKASNRLFDNQENPMTIEDAEEYIANQQEEKPNEIPDEVLEEFNQLLIDKIRAACDKLEEKTKASKVKKENKNSNKKDTLFIATVSNFEQLITLCKGLVVHKLNGDVYTIKKNHRNQYKVCIQIQNKKAEDAYSIINEFLITDENNFIDTFVDKQKEPRKPFIQILYLKEHGKKVSTVKQISTL